MQQLGFVDVLGRAIPIVMHGDRETIEVSVGDGSAVLAYELVGHSIDLASTHVPPALRGRGVGSALARAALEYARQERLKVKPTCPFVARFIDAHPEYQDLIDPDLKTPVTK